MKARFWIFGILTAAICANGNCIAFAQDVAPPGTKAFDPRNPPTETVAKPHETLFDIAERTRSPLQGIIEVNGFSPPFEISAGQVIKLPPLKVHVVQPGETFDIIADRYSVDTRSLAIFNNLPKPYKVSIGQKIILPAMVTDTLTGLEPRDLVDLLASEIGAGRQVSGAKKGTIHRDNTIPQLPEFSTEANGVIPTPPIKSPDTITPPVIKPPVKTPETKPVITKPPETKPVIKSPTDTKMANVIPNDVIANTTSNIKFAWPIRGKIIDGYGDKPGFRRNDGIDIDAKENTPFFAAADGEVAYVGDQLQGYGWLILVKHDAKYITAYAYCSEPKVKEGQKVKKGQVLGLVGKTGRATTPRLHFQIREDTKAENPLKYLPKAG